MMSLFELRFVEGWLGRNTYPDSTGRVPLCSDIPARVEHLNMWFHSTCNSRLALGNLPVFYGHRTFTSRVITHTQYLASLHYGLLACHRLEFMLPVTRALLTPTFGPNLIHTPRPCLVLLVALGFRGLEFRYPEALLFKKSISGSPRTP